MGGAGGAKGVANTNAVSGAEDAGWGSTGGAENAEGTKDIAEAGVAGVIREIPKSA